MNRWIVVCVTRKSNDQGRAFEFITSITLKEEISPFREVVIEKNSSYYAAEYAWENLDTNIQINLKQLNRQ